MRAYLLGILSCASVLVACGAMPIFPYKYYHLSGNNFAGTLMGKEPKDDVPFDECRPVNGKQKCVVVQYPVLTALVSDYKKTKQDLIDCQRGR